MSVYGPPTPVPILQWQTEFQTLLELYKERAPKRVLEVGTYHGGTLYHWLANAAQDATVVTIDSYQAGADNRHLYHNWVRDDVTLVVVEGDSRGEHTIATVRDFAPYDWVFIDAGHYLHEVTSDWNIYGGMCAQGGLVAFHDILPPTQQHPEIEVAELWQQIKATHRTVEIIENPANSWGGIGVVLL